MLLLLGSCLLFKIIAAEGCSANQQSTTTLTAPSLYDFFPKPQSRRLPFNANCQWKITAPVGKVVKIWVNKARFNGPCNDEYLRIYDGPSKSSNILVQYCNGAISSRLSLYFISTGRDMFLDVKTGITNSTRLSVYFQAEDFQDCSLNKTLDALEWPTVNTFSSPYYPDVYPVNTTCGWYITAPQNHIVELNLTSYYNSLIPSDDSVEVYDVEGSELSVISLHLRTESLFVTTIYSKFRSLYVLFKSGNKPETDTKGISVSYAAIKTVHSCSSSNSEMQNMNIILNDPGTIKTPGHPSNYPKDLITQCIWKIIAPKGQVVRLSFSSFRMGLARCVDVKNSINKNEPLEISYCGWKKPFTVYSTGRELSLNVPRSYLSETSGPGFLADYLFLPAGISSGNCVLKDKSIIHMAAGDERNFATPGDPESSGTGTCSWNITVPPGFKFIKLNFLTDSMGLCSENYAEVFDVTNSKTKDLTGKFCRQKVVYSEGNNVLVKYTRLKSSYSAKGFIASYQAAPASYACTQVFPYVSNLTGDTGEFASFNYPLPYSNDVRCSWALEIPVGYRVQLDFLSFDLQESQDCQIDYLEVKKGFKEEWATPVGRFCGPYLPDSLQLNSNMYVNFVTDSSRTDPGFHASFKVTPNNTAMGPCKLQGVDNVIPLTGVTGRLFSPLYPDFYPPNMMCTWKITVPEGHFAKLSIRSFNLEKSCDGPVLEIRDGQTSSSNLLKTFCGEDFEPSVFASGRHLWIRFQTPADKHLGGTGFDASFEAVTQLPAPFSCTGGHRDIALNSDTGGSLASYNYPLPYEGNMKCTWDIKVDSGYKVVLSFDSFNLSKSMFCLDDYVKVHYENFCGSEKPETITSYHGDEKLSVKFKSSGNAKYPGFKATYTRKRVPMPLIIIVGICLGAVFVLCVVIAVSYKCWQKRKRANDAKEEMRRFGAASERVALQEPEEQATSL